MSGRESESGHGRESGSGCGCESESESESKNEDVKRPSTSFGLLDSRHQSAGDQIRCRRVFFSEYHSRQCVRVAWHEGKMVMH